MVNDTLVLFLVTLDKGLAVLRVSIVQSLPGALGRSVILSRQALV